MTSGKSSSVVGIILEEWNKTPANVTISPSMAYNGCGHFPLRINPKGDTMVLGFYLHTAHNAICIWCLSNLTD